MRQIPSQAKETAKPQNNKRTAVETSENESTLDAHAFPYQATLQGDEVPLLKHGGGTILTLKRRRRCNR